VSESAFDAALRVGMDAAFSARVFGVPVTVRRPPPDDTPISTTGIWVTRLDDERPMGHLDLQRREPRRVFALRRTSELQALPRGSQIEAPETSTGAVLTWQVDGYDVTREIQAVRQTAFPVEADMLQVIVTRVLS